MSKYIKIEVPDDFNPEDDLITFTMNDPNHTGDHEPNKIIRQVYAWTPPYVTVLDHGFVGLVDFMGDDNAVVQAARVSYGNGTKKVSQDRGLLRYLMRHRHCYHPSMEVLTATGWKRWDECAPMETFMVPNPRTGALVPERLEVKAFLADEDLYTFSNDRMSYKVTSDHKMWFKGKYRSGYEKVKVQDMPKWGWFQPLTEYSKVGDGPNVNAFFAFMGFYLGDGSYASTNRITFHLCKPRKIEYLTRLLGALQFPYTTAPSGTHADGVVFYVETPDELREWIDVTARAEDKAFPMNRLVDLHDEEINGLFEGLVNSDGHVPSVRKAQIQFSSSSPHLLKLFETLAAFIGYDAHATSTHMTAYTRDGRTSLESRKMYHGREAYCGMVYCATTSTGLLMVRGGSDKFGFVCGNTTPFEMVEFKFHVKAPIFVFRQWHRHRTFSINEYSGRYSIMTDEMYLPAAENVKAQSSDNKQGRATDDLSKNDIDAVLLALEESFVQAWQTYQYLLEAGAVPPEHINNRKLWLQESAVNVLKKLREDNPDVEFGEAALDDKIKEFYDANEFAVTGGDFPGLARELARIVLPVATYSQMYWKGNLKNLLHFIGLRSDPHAQYEIRVFSDALLELIKPHVPWSVEAFMDYEFNGGRLSSVELSTLKTIVQHYVGLEYAGDTKPLEDRLLLNGSTKREVRELFDKLGL